MLIRFVQKVLFLKEAVTCLLFHIFFKSSGFNMTSSGETSNCLVRIGILLSKRRFANANGVAPVRFSHSVDPIGPTVFFLQICRFFG